MQTAVYSRILNWHPQCLTGDFLGSARLLDYRRGVLVFDETGRITHCGPEAKLPAALKRQISRKLDFRDKVILPGLIDLHVHLPQIGATGSDGYPLLPWLKKYIFPVEKRFKDPKVAATTAKIFCEELVKAGTTSAVTYGPVYPEAVEACFEASERVGNRMWLGQTLMDIQSYRKVKSKKLLKEMEAQIKTWHGHKDRLHYIVSPRYVLVCTPKLMQQAAELAKQEDLMIQSHLSENHDEIRAVRKAFPDHASYTQVYDAMGLLTDKTIMGHCLHLSESELRLMAKRGTAIAYCPSSNLFLQSGILDFGPLKKHGLAVALASDVAAGTDLSMVETMKLSILAQKAAGIYNADRVSNYNVDVVQHFYLATAAAGRILDSNIGHLNKNAWADFIVVDPERCDSLYNAYPKLIPKSTSDLLAKIIYAGTRPIIDATFVAGQCVYQSG